jgi:hypothetical protein
LEAVINKWLTALEGVDEYYQRAVLENQGFILDSNIAQLETGRDSLGNFLREYASEDYAVFKQMIGSKAPFGIADLKLTGDFYSGFTLTFEGDSFRITSTDEKTEHLRAKYGNDIFGLAQERIEMVIPFLLNSFIKHFRHGLL